MVKVKVDLNKKKELLWHGKISGRPSVWGNGDLEKKWKVLRKNLPGSLNTPN